MWQNRRMDSSDSNLRMCSMPVRTCMPTHESRCHPAGAWARAAVSPSAPRLVSMLRVWLVCSGGLRGSGTPLTESGTSRPAVGVG